MLTFSRAGVCKATAPRARSWRALGHLCKRSFDGTSRDCKNGRSEGGKIGMTPTKSARTPLPCRLIGYARVSTEDQGTDPQLDELRAAGCAAVLQEHASGA